MKTQQFTLEVQERKEFGHSVRHLRAEGIVPGVVYGAGQPSTAVQMDAAVLDRLMARGGATHVISLSGANMPPTRVLIREVQRHPVRRTIQHVDLVRIAAGAKVRVAVPLIVIGTAPATEHGAILLQTDNSLEVECLPEDLPESLEVDVSHMEEISQRITVADVALPAGVEAVGYPADHTLISLTIPRGVIVEEEEEEEEEMEYGVEPELIREREEEEEED